MTSLPVLNCDGCGACCEAQGSPPGYDAPESRAHLPAELRAELDIYFQSARRLGLWRRGLPCLWYDLERQRCLHYEWRPPICRDFKVNSPGCREWRHVLGKEGVASNETGNLSGADADGNDTAPEPAPVPSA